MSSHLIEPHGGTLVNLLASEDRAAELREHSREWPSWDLTARQLCDLELLMNGGFSPLTGFMTSAEYDAVCQNMRLPSGVLWPMPIVLDVSDECAQELSNGDKLALRDLEGVMLAVLHVEDVWQPDRVKEAVQVFGTENTEHPGVAQVRNQTNPWYVGGSIEGVEPPRHYDFVEYRRTPAEVRELFSELGWQRVVAFQTRNPMHKAHYELTYRAASDNQANLLLHPVVGMTKPGDVDHYTRVRCYKALLDKYPRNTVMLSLLPLAMRMGGPREAVWHAIIRKNHGCTHFIVGRDHAGPGKDSAGNEFYGPYDAQDMLKEYSGELGIEMVPFRMMGYVPEKQEHYPVDEVPEGLEVKTLSGTELRERLAKGTPVPDWFSFPEVIDELRRTYPPMHKRGFTVFFTGLPSSGKSTVANCLLVKLLEMGGRPVTLLDGDLVRKHLSSELGFSKEHRNINIQRIGFVASEITKNGGVAICAPIAPYAQTRQAVQDMIEAKQGRFILVHVSTPLEVCEQRDRKGLYAKARAGIVKEFTGISDPYEEPENPDMRLATTDTTPEEAAQSVLLYLEKEGLIGPNND